MESQNPTDALRGTLQNVLAQSELAVHVVQIAPLLDDELLEVELEVVLVAVVDVEVDVVLAAEVDVVPEALLTDAKLALVVVALLDEALLPAVPLDAPEVDPRVVEEALEPRPVLPSEEAPEVDAEVWMMPDDEAVVVAVDPSPVTHWPDALQTAPAEWQSEFTAHSTSQVPGGPLAG